MIESQWAFKSTFDHLKFKITAGIPKTAGILKTAGIRAAASYMYKLTRVENLEGKFQIANMIASKTKMVSELHRLRFAA